jgi:hypothetical protein
LHFGLAVGAPERGRHEDAAPALAPLADEPPLDDEPELPEDEELDDDDDVEDAGVVELDDESDFVSDLLSDELGLSEPAFPAPARESLR